MPAYDELRSKYFLPVRPLDHYLNALRTAGFRIHSLRKRTIEANVTEWYDFLAVYHEGVLGWVHCTENILSEARGNISVTSVLATNIFERSGGEWLMVHHHASHILTGDPSRQG